MCRRNVRGRDSATVCIDWTNPAAKSTDIRRQSKSRSFAFCANGPIVCGNAFHLFCTTIASLSTAVGQRLKTSFRLELIIRCHGNSIAIHCDSSAVYKTPDLLTYLLAATHCSANFRAALNPFYTHVIRSCILQSSPRVASLMSRRCVCRHPTVTADAVSYTHLTLPTKRIV